MFRTRQNVAVVPGGEVKTTSMPHVPALDGVRGMAVVAVLLFHGGHLRGGYLGVDLFFTLSGLGFGLCQITSLRRYQPSACNASAVRHGRPTRSPSLMPGEAVSLRA